jgi:membrane-bound lytic murein transglycosylase D
MMKKGKKISVSIFCLLGLMLLSIQSTLAFQPDTIFSQRLKMIEKNIPYQLTEELQDAIYRKMYTDQTESELILTRSVAYLPLIEKELWQNDLPSEFKYIPVAMSGLDPTSITYNGGAGIWGLQYIISKKYGLQVNEFEDERRDHIKSTCVAIQYMQDLQKNYGNWTLTLLAFITSPSDVNSAICRSGNSSDPWKIYEQMSNKQKGLFIEFIASAYLLNYYDTHGIQKKQPDFEWANCNSYPVESNTGFADLASYLGISESNLKQANPTFRSHYIPGNKGFTVRIPVKYSDKFSSYKPADVLNIAVVQNQSSHTGTITTNQNTNDHGAEVVSNNTTNTIVKTTTNTNKGTTGSYQTTKTYYKVKSGDNLGKIAGKYNVSVSSIKSWNSLKSDKIYIGQKICIQKKTWVASKVEVTTTQNNTDTEKTTDTTNKTVTDQNDQKTTTTTDTKTQSNNTTEVKTDDKTVNTTTTVKSWVTYKVEKGDTLWKIATKHNVSVDEVRNNNNLVGDKIIVGQTLKIKSK